MTNAEPLFPYHIDNTMRVTFVSCPQKFYNEFILGLRTGKSIDLHAGGCFAKTLEIFYHAYYIDKATMDQARSRAFHAFANEWGNYVPPDNHVKTFDRMWEAFEDYRRHYDVRYDHIQPYFVSNVPTFEFSFAIPLDDPIFPRHPVTNDPLIYCGRFDMLGYHKTWEVPIIRDEKTSSRGGPSWPNQWSLRSQLTGYSWACHQYGLEVDHVCMRGVIIHKDNFDQLEFIKHFTDRDRARWYYQLSRDIHRMVECWRQDYWDFNLAEACTSFSGCPYRQVCEAHGDPTEYDDYVLDRWNPLDRFPTQQIAPKDMEATSNDLKLEDFMS